MKKLSFYLSKTLLVLCLMAPLSGLHAQSENDYDYYRGYGHRNAAWNSEVAAGFSAYAKKDCDATVEHLKNAVSLQCKDAVVYFKLALCYELLDNSYTAEQYYQLAGEKLKGLKSPHRYQSEIFENYGRLLYKLKKYDEALAQFQKALARGRANFSIYYFLGNIYTEKKDKALALNYFQQGLQQDLSHVSADILTPIYLESANALLAQEQFKEALAMAERGLQTDPQNLPLKQAQQKAQNEISRQAISGKLTDFTNKQNEPKPLSQPPPPAASKLPPLEPSYGTE